MNSSQKEESVGWGKCLYLHTHKYAQVHAQTDTCVHECKHAMYTHAKIKYLRSTLFSQDPDQSLGACLCLCSPGQNIASSSLPARLMPIMFSKDQPRGVVGRDQYGCLVQRNVSNLTDLSQELGRGPGEKQLGQQEAPPLGAPPPLTPTSPAPPHSKPVLSPSPTPHPGMLTQAF